MRYRSSNDSLAITTSSYSFRNCAIGFFNPLVFPNLSLDQYVLCRTREKF